MLRADRDAERFNKTDPPALPYPNVHRTVPPRKMKRLFHENG